MDAGKVFYTQSMLATAVGVLTQVVKVVGFNIDKKMLPIVSAILGGCMNLVLSIIEMQKLDFPTLISMFVVGAISSGFMASGGYDTIKGLSTIVKKLTQK